MKKGYVSILAAGLLVMGGALPAQAELVITPQLSTLQSLDTDNVVTFDASRSACYDYTVAATDRVTGTTYECSGGSGVANTDSATFTGNCVVDDVAGSANTCNVWTDCLPACDLSGADFTANPIVPGICPDGATACISNADCRNSMLTSGTMTPLACDFTWDFGDSGAGAESGGNGNDTIVYQYAAAGSYDVTLNITEPVSGATASKNVTVTAVAIQPLPITATFSTVETAAVCVANQCAGGGRDGYACTGDAGCPGGAVTLTFDTAAANLARAYIYWGDQQRSIVVNPTVSTSATHMYSREKTYNIRVMILDTDHQRQDYTYTEDADLSVNP